MYRYLFGPVASRRFGRSLGVDLLPGKICSFDCVFCEVGRTKNLTVVRREYVPTAEVVSELRQWATSGDRTDFITLAGSGEPTLHTGFGEVLAAAADLRVARTALLTNGSLLHLPEVRAGAAKADVVKIALGAVSEGALKSLNRPHAGVDLGAILRGGAEFRRQFRGSLWVEVFVVGGLNDTEEALRPVAERLLEWRPDKIHLNTVDRPPADAAVSAAPVAALERLASLFVPRAEVAARGASRVDAGNEPDRRRIAAMLARRPGTAMDVAAACGLDVCKAASILEEMTLQGVLTIEQRPEGVFFRCKTA